MSANRSVRSHAVATIAHRAAALFVLCMSVAVSACGEAPRSDLAQRQSAETWSHGPQAWNIATLTPKDAAATTSFGSPIAMSADGNTLLASSADKGVLVFVRESSGWAQQAILADPSAASDAWFGAALALSRDGNTALVGDPYADGSARDSGAVYWFSRSGTTWSLRGTLPITVIADGRIGRSVSLSGDGMTALVQTPRQLITSANWPGTAQVFSRGATAWTLTATLSSALDEIRPLMASSGLVFVGGSVVISDDGNTLLATIEHLNTTAHLGGLVYVRSGATWKFEALLMTVGRVFTTPIFVSISQNGSAVLLHGKQFLRSGGTWKEAGPLTIGSRSSLVGQALSFDGRLAAYATAGDYGGSWLSIHDGIGWSSPARIYLDPFSRPSPQALSWSRSKPELLALGSPGSISGRGAAFLVAISREDGFSCTSSAECTSGNCIDGVCCDTDCGAGSESDCQACSRAKGASADGVCGPIEAGRTCRAASGACDRAEVCDGTALTCPTDKIQNSKTLCRPAVPGGCDVADYCTGKSKECPVDKVVTAPSSPCRPASGDCDVAEWCDGVNPACPSDGFKLPTQKCREANSTNACDLAEYCTGMSAACPPDAFKEDGAACKPTEYWQDCVDPGSCQDRECKDYQRVPKAEKRACDPNDPRLICDGLGGCSLP